MRRRSVTDLLDLTPFWLYELLPSIYILAGILAFALLDHYLGQASAALLVGTGLYVTFIRWRARQRQTRHQRDPEVALLGMTWMRNYVSGEPVMDGEHQDLFEQSHAILAGLLEGKGSRVDELINELCESVERHFRNEEDLLFQSGARDLRTHRRSHQRLTAQLRKLRRRRARGEIARSALVQFILHEMIRGHMVSEDIGPLEEAARAAQADARIARAR